MNKQEKNKPLIEIINQAIKQVEKHKETLLVGEEFDSIASVNVLNSLLYRLGVRKPKQNSTAPKNAFSKKEVKESGSINNKPPKNAFKRKDFKEEFEEAFKNKAPANAFKKKELVPEQLQQKEKFEKEIKKTGNKWSKRLNQEKKTRITALFKNNFSIEDISNELWIEEKTIAKFLGIKAPSVVIADNTTNKIDEFIQEVKDSKQ